MSFVAWAQVALLLALVFAAAFPVGRYMAGVFTGEIAFTPCALSSAPSAG